jgi:hypothetical protein
MSSHSDELIRRSAIRLRMIVFAAMAVVGLAYAAAGLNLQLAHAHVEYRLDGVASRYEELIGAGSLVLLLMALFRLSQMLGRIAAGELFSAVVIARFRGFAWWLLLMALFELLAPVAVGLAAPSHGPNGHMRLAIDLRDVLTVGITLLLFLLARLLERARLLDEEVREFV